MRRLVTPTLFLLTLLALLATACSSTTTECTDAGCPAATCPDVAQGMDTESPPDVPEDPDIQPTQEIGEPEPTYWSAAATPIADDIAFAEHQGERVFAIGFDGKKGPIWDHVTTEGCDRDTGVGYADVVIEGYDRALEAGANFVFMWGYPSPDWEHYEDWLDRISMMYGKWHGNWSVNPPAERDVIPLFHNGWGESDFDNDHIEDTIAAHEAEMEEWETRTGRYSPENAPNLPPFEDMPWIAWHPTWRSRGGGDGTGEVLTDDQARRLINSANMAIGDNYTYVTNRFPSALGAFTGQKGEQGEGYDDWIAVADPEHESYYRGAWEVAWALERFAERPILRWMWIQGYSFGAGIAAEECRGETTDAWATGWFPSLPYLRKEVMSSLAAGATGIVFFGYQNAHPIDREKVETIFRALSAPEVYGPALLSPRLDIASKEALAASGEGGRVHALLKWDEETKRAFLLGANPGPWQTTAQWEFPWTLAKAEILMWGSQRFVESPRLTIHDKTLELVAPMDEGFILRVTPLFEPAE